MARYLDRAGGWCLRLAALFLLCRPICAPAAEGGGARSLLFAPEEEAAIKKAIAEFDRMQVGGVRDEDSAAPAIPNIYVSAIADFGDGQWAVWANGYHISPTHPVPGFVVLSVKDDRVEFSVAAKGDHPIRVVLRPYQTWRSRSNDVVEGIVK